MSMFGGSGILGGIHSDLLKSEPTTTIAKVSLVEEIKNRGRNSFQTGNFPEAEVLYTKGIEVSDVDELKGALLAILYSNRALARLNIGKVTEALEDSNLAIEQDSTYIKGFWRKGQALVALKKNKQALAAFENAQTIEPKNSQLKKEISKVEAKIEQEALLAEAEDDDDEPPAIIESDKEFLARVTPKNKTTPQKSTPSSSTTSTTTSSKTSSTTSKAEITDDIKPDEKIRGYKLNKDGKKTSFFNNDLTEEAAKLIGDIAPKKIASAAEAMTPAAVKAEKGVSAWNTAGTWEEKNLDKWGNASMKKMLSERTFAIPGEAVETNPTIKVVKIKDYEGSASVVKVRGKTRYNYEFSFTLEWEVLLPSGPCKGELKFPDVAPDCEGAYESTYSVDRSTPGDAKGVLERFVKRDGDGLKKEISDGINKWVVDFKAEFV